MKMENRINIAIDGPAGAGKSTVARLVAKKLSFLYIDTGAMYRALTYAALNNRIATDDGGALRQLLDRSQIRFINNESKMSVHLNGHDVTEAIRMAEVNQHVSQVSSHPEVREEMVERQRQMAKEGQAVLDGRDIGTHVLPQAGVKVFLTATVEERARRRHEEQVAKGIPSRFEQLKQEIARRDELDSTREVAPLQKAKDAIEIDTTSLAIADVARRLLS